MLKSIRAKVALAGASVLLLCGGSAGLGLWTATNLTGALEDSTLSSEILNNHMEADMMHDALRSDVLSAIMASDPATGIKLSEVRTETAEHADIFRKAIEANKALAANTEIHASLADVEQPLAAYIASAENIIALADRDPAAARAALTPFKRAFLDLETRMGKVSEDIQAASTGAKTRAERGAALSDILMLGAIVIGLVFSALLIVASLRMIVRPIRRLADEMRALASGRTDIDLTSARRGDEIGAVGRAVGDLQDLIVERTRSEAAEADRRRAAEEAQRADEERAREIRAPSRPGWWKPWPTAWALSARAT